MGHLPQRILLATDGSADAALALRAAVDLATAGDAELHVAHAWRASPEWSHPAVAMASDAALYEREAQETLLGQLDRIEAAGGTATGAHLMRGRPAEVVADVAADLGAGLVVVGSRGLGRVERLAMGSTSEGVVDLAPCPVLVVRGGEEAWPPRRVVVGDDSSAGARRAAELATSIAGLFGVGVLLLRALPVVLPVGEARERSRPPAAVSGEARVRHELELAARARRLERDLGIRPRVRVVPGEAARAILGAAEEGGGPALVAVGRRGIGRLERLRLGSVSTKTVRAAWGPVLVVPP